MTCYEYKEISFKQLDTLFENLKPMKLKRRETFQEYTNFLTEEDLIDEENVDKYSTIDYIRDFEEFEKERRIKRVIEEDRNNLIDMFFDFSSKFLFICIVLEICKRYS